MRRIRIYFPGKIEIGGDVVLPVASSRHLVQVLRKNSGDHCYIFNGDGFEYHAIIVDADKKKTTLQITDCSQPAVESPVNIHLGQGLSRGDRMDYAIQKAVELGVFEITPLVTEFSQVKLSADRLEKRIAHWQGIAISAAEQSGRCMVPIINQPIKVSEWITNNNADLKFICCPRNNTVQSAASQPTKTVSVAVGPEGGFSNDEVTFAQQNEFASLSLGPRVLRTETAAVVALTLLQSRFGDC